MRTTGRARQVTRILGSGLLVGALAMGLASVSTTAYGEESATTPATPTPGTDQSSEPAAGAVTAESAVAAAAPYGSSFPIVQETNFARPVRAVSSDAYADFSQLDDLERLIRGTYLNPNGTRISSTLTVQNNVRMSMSRMERSKRVGRTLLAAAKAGVTVVFVHGKDSQSAASRSLQTQLNAVRFNGKRTGYFYICAKGQSLACLSSAKGGIIHTKSLIIKSTFTRNGDPAKGAVWFGSANIGGPSGAYTWNNGLTIYNDKKLYVQAYRMFSDLMAERNVGNNYPAYIQSHNTTYGYAGATADGYTSDYATPGGMFYSNLSNMTIYASPIAATPTNGRDPIMAALNRIVPDSTCKIRVDENRWKYRRLAIAEKLVELSNRGCQVSVVAFQDDLLANRILHCQIYIRICRPILDELRTAKVHIGAAYAKPHDKVILIEARMMRSALNTYERKPDGSPWAAGAANAIPMTMVQAGSAALTGSNLVSSDEVTTESLDPQVYADYLEHWRALNISREFRNYPY